MSGRIRVAGLLALVLLTALLVAAAPAAAAPPVSGAIFTTIAPPDTAVNVNIYYDKEDVWLNGGPAHPGAAGLPDGYYYCQVTEPDGTLLGTSVGSGNATPIHVVDGEFAPPVQLWAILIKASDGTQGYDSTTNPGGEYKVWVSNVSTFDNDSTKTDNFKVRENGGGGGDIAMLGVIKFYDANANGINDDGIDINGLQITGWKVSIQDGMDIVRYTPVSVIVEPDDYFVTEWLPDPASCCCTWMRTAGDVVGCATLPPGSNPVAVTLAAGDQKTVEFGNLCLGYGGGHTLGFWSNKNGGKLITGCDLSDLQWLNLRNADGSLFVPTSVAQVQAWLLKASAVNMANMLSAQLAAMLLNCRHGFVDYDALIYAPGTMSANALGFATVWDIILEARAELYAHGYTPDGSPYRGYQEALKCALDNANNNKTFVVPWPACLAYIDTWNWVWPVP